MLKRTHVCNLKGAGLGGGVVCVGDKVDASRWRDGILAEDST